MKYFPMHVMGLFSKCITSLYMPQLKYSQIFKMTCDAKNIWCENMLKNLSLEIICSSKLTIFLKLCCRKTVPFLRQIMTADKYPSTFLRQWRSLFTQPWLSNNGHYMFPSLMHTSHWGGLPYKNYMGYLNGTRIF